MEVDLEVRTILTKPCEWSRLITTSIILSGARTNMSFMYVILGYLVHTPTNMKLRTGHAGKYHESEHLTFFPMMLTSCDHQSLLILG